MARVLERMTFATPLSGCGFYDIDGTELGGDLILSDIRSRSMVVKGSSPAMRLR